MAAVVWLPEPPLPQTTSVLGHDQHDAVVADAKVVQPANALNVAEPLHDGNLPESSDLHGRHPLHHLKVNMQMSGATEPNWRHCNVEVSQMLRLAS